MMLKKIGIASVFVLAMPLVAIAGEGKVGDDTAFKAMDTNGDGKLSTEEHTAGASKMFETMDANKDGKVTGDEMTAAREKAGKPEKAGMSAADKIKVLDTDGDGALSAAEHTAGAKQMFGKLDADKDGFVTASERTAGHEKYMKEGKAGESKPTEPPPAK